MYNLSQDKGFKRTNISALWILALIFFFFFDDLVDEWQKFKESSPYF